MPYIDFGEDVGPAFQEMWTVFTLPQIERDARMHDSRETPAVRAGDAYDRKEEIFSSLEGRFRASMRRGSASHASTRAAEYLDRNQEVITDLLFDLGESHQVFPEIVSSSMTNHLRDFRIFTSSYIALCDQLIKLAGTRWRIPGRPWRKSELIADFLHSSLIALNEVTLLVSHGFPDGAIARSRTNIELATLSRVVQLNGVELVHRYRMSGIPELHRQLERGQLRIGPTEEEFLRQKLVNLIHKYGPGFAKPYGWALPAFPGKKQVFFGDLYRKYGLELGKSEYSNSSHYVHAGYTGFLKSRSTDVSGVFLNGPRPLGFMDPAYVAVAQTHYCATALCDELYQSSSDALAQYWSQILDFARIEAQAELATAQMALDPEWARQTFSSAFGDFPADTAG